MKKKKELLLLGVIVLIGVGCIYLMCLRAEQIDKETKSEKINKAILDIMY